MSDTRSLLCMSLTPTLTRRSIFIKVTRCACLCSVLFVSLTVLLVASRTLSRSLDHNPLIQSSACSSAISLLKDLKGCCMSGQSSGKYSLRYQSCLLFLLLLADILPSLPPVAFSLDSLPLSKLCTSSRQLSDLSHAPTPVVMQGEIHTKQTLPLCLV